MNLLQLEQFKLAVLQLERNEFEQLLGKALGYPVLYPQASNDDDGTVGIGEHTPATLAQEAKAKIEQLIKDRDRLHDLMIRSISKCPKCRGDVDELDRLRGLLQRIADDTSNDSACSVRKMIRNALDPVPEPTIHGCQRCGDQGELHLWFRLKNVKTFIWSVCPICKGKGLIG